MPMNDAGALVHRHTRITRSECILNVRGLKKEALQKAVYHSREGGRDTFGFSDESRLVRVLQLHDLLMGN
jgi:hypothetical protein